MTKLLYKIDERYGRAGVCALFSLCLLLITDLFPIIFSKFIYPSQILVKRSEWITQYPLLPVGEIIACTTLLLLKWERYKREHPNTSAVQKPEPISTPAEFAHESKLRVTYPLVSVIAQLVIVIIGNLTGLYVNKGLINAQIPWLITVFLITCFQLLSKREQAFGWIIKVNSFSIVLYIAVALTSLEHSMLRANFRFSALMTAILTINVAILLAAKMGRKSISN